MRNIGLFISLTLLLLCSCKEHQQIANFNPETLCATVIEIDSINNAIIQNSDGVPTVINQETGEPYSEQEILDAWARVAKDWRKFTRYILRHKFENAAEFLLDTNNRGSILGHLRDSELRAVFILDVVDNLLLEYQEDGYYSIIADWEYTEVLTQMNLNGITYGNPHDVAPSFARLVLSYGLTLSSAGCLDNALELVPIYNLANIYYNPEDDFWQQYNKVYFENTLYHLAGQGAKGDSILLDFQDNVTPEYGARGKEAAKDIDEIIAYWKEKELFEGYNN